MLPFLVRYRLHRLRRRISPRTRRGLRSRSASRSSSPVNNTGYTLQLSEAQQVYQLYNQGQGIPQIATALNLSVSVIDNYLGITNGGS